MNDYIPFKYSPKRLSKNNSCFKQLCDSYKPRAYTLKDEGTHRYGNVSSDRPKTDTRFLIDRLYFEKFEKMFPNQINSPKVIVRTFEANMHRDPNWDSNLFLTVVLQAARKGHVLCASKWHFEKYEKVSSTSIFLRQGDVFLLDPLSIHSVHSTSKEKSELVLLQYELEFGTRERAERVMQGCSWESVGIIKD